MTIENLKYFNQNINLLRQYNESTENNPVNNLKGSFAEHNIVDLTDKFVSTTPVVAKQLMRENLEEKIEIMINKNWYGFESNSTYIQFFKFINKLRFQNNLNHLFSISYLRTKILLWLIENKINEIEDYNIGNEIQKLINADVKVRLFHYPISNLDIEKEIAVGPHKITYFKREYFDKYYQQLYENNSNKNQKKLFDKEIRKYQGCVFVTIKIKAEPQIAEKLAYKEACKVIDVFKLFTPTLYFPPEQCNIDLDSRISPKSNHLISEPNKIGFSISTSKKGRHLNFTNEMLGDFLPLIQILSGIFLPNDNNQLRKQVKESISLLSKALNDEDLHRRISLLISICETIFLLENENYKMEKKCKRRMAYFIQPKEPAERKKISELLEIFYNIRHKIQHKSIRLYIDLIKMRDFQVFIVDVFRLMMYDSRQYDLKENWLKNLDDKSCA